MSVLMIPPVVRQTWRTKTESTWSFAQRRWVSTWKSQTGFVHELSDDADCLAFVQARFPELVEVYGSLRPVEKADLWRYLVIYEHGGIYADFDTVCKKPMSRWLQPQDGLVLGVETDLSDDYPDWAPVGRLQSGGFHRLGTPWRDNVVLFCNWTFAARPGHPILKDVIRRVAINVGDPFFHTHADWTIKKTGPGVLTDAVNDFLADNGRTAVELARELRRKREIVIGDVRFLDRPAFNNGHVHHLGLGSWKPRRGFVDHALRRFRTAF